MAVIHVHACEDGGDYRIYSVKKLVGYIILFLVKPNYCTNSPIFKSTVFINKAEAEYILAAIL